MKIFDFPMNLLLLIIISAVLLCAGYFIYGFFLQKWFKLNNARATPAVTMNNNSDFIPTGRFYLLGQHLSAIAAAGPIVGPILAGMWFGWFPTFLWIIFGGIFIGGVHDMAAIVASVRHEGKSIAEVIKASMGRRAFTIFLLFLWFSLIYIIAAFTDITASTFVDKARGPGVASASMLYLLLAFIMGIVLRLWPMRLSLATAIFLPFVFLCIYVGPMLPLRIPSLFGLDERTTWNMALMVYCFIAAVIPMWVLLQPRGYLGGFFLTLTAGISLVGIIIGQFTANITVQYPPFVSWVNAQGLPLLPLLFTTVACGACSGFHCLICSGTTSKQLTKETDAKVVGYGGMLLESFVAVTALGTVMILTTTQAQELKDPNQIYANGIAVFLSYLGIPKELALNFALLAFATFVYDTLDVATRLGRYIFQELTGLKGKVSPYIATLVTLILPIVFLNQKMTDAQGNVIPSWKIFWTAFGSSNQLLAAMVLLGLSLWMFKAKMKYAVTLLPSLFMTVIAVSSLYLIMKPWLINVFTKGMLTPDPVGITGILLLILTFFLIAEGLKAFRRKEAS